MSHQMEEHLRDTKFNCVGCHRQYELQQALRHGKSHHEHWCAVCDMELKTDHDLRQHIKNEHSRESRAQTNFIRAIDTTGAAVPGHTVPDAHQPPSLLPDFGSVSVQTAYEAYLAVEGILGFLTWHWQDLLTISRIATFYELSMHLQHAVSEGETGALQPTLYSWAFELRQEIAVQ